MNDHDDPERILRAAATAATAAHHAGVSPAETDAALAAVRARAAAGDTGTIATTTALGRRTTRWRTVAAAAAAAALIGGGTLAITLRSDDDRTVVPDTGPTVASTVAPTSTVESTGAALTQPTIPYQCVGENVCTQLIGTSDGRIVAYFPVDETLAVYDSGGTQELQRVPLATPLAAAYPALVTVGPADVVYVDIATPAATDPISDLIAIALTGPAAGTVVQRWTGLDGSGDSTLVPQVDGIVTVPCCGFIETRPSPDAQRYPYVDGNGAAISSSAPTFRLDLAPDAGTLVRIDNGIETVFALPTEFQGPRDFPRVVATTEGGALALDWIDVPAGGGMFIARFLPAAGERAQRVDVFRLDTTDVALLEPGGTVVVVEGDHFARRQITDIGTLSGNSTA